MNSTYSAEYVWKIEHFSSCNPGTEIGARIDSEFFGCPNKKNIKFRLGFCPNNKTTRNECTSIFLWIGCEKSINANIISFDILSSSNGAVVFNKSLQNEYVPANAKRGWGFPSFATRKFIFNPKNNALDNDTLTIRCRIEFRFGDVMVVLDSPKIQDDEDEKKVFNAEYLWKINNFKNHFKLGARLDSDFFNCEEKPEIGFRMGLCPNGDIPENEGYLSLYLWIGSHDRSVNTKIIFEMIKNDNTTISKERQQIVSPHEDRGWGFPQFYKFDEVFKPENNILKHGCLTIHVKVEFTFVENISPPPSSFEFIEAEEEMEAENAFTNFFEIQDTEYFTEFIWKIENFSQINSDIGNRVESAIFPCTGNPDIRFHLGLNPNGCSDGNKGYLSVYLWVGSSEDLCTTISMELLNKNDYNSKYIKERRDMIPNNSTQGWGFDQYIHRSVVLDPDNGYLDNDILTIKCKIIANLCKF